MEKLSVISVIILLILSGCSENKQASDGVITVDVTASYPQKELILQDFMDVEYVPLEMNDEFVTQDLVLDISKNMILLRNHPGDGNLFIFDRNGKALKKINRRGEGAEEYNIYMWAVLDEEKEEIFVNDRPAQEILVYNLDGDFKRSLKQTNTSYNLVNTYNFDRGNLICRNEPFENVASFVVISKQDGSVTGEIQIPFKERISIVVHFEMNNASYNTSSRAYKPIISDFGNWILTEPSSDTVYRYQAAHHTLTPVIVRTPSIQSMRPEVFLFPRLFTERYYFMDAVKKEVDLSKDEWFPSTQLMYDKQEKAIFKYTIYNGDYTDERPIKIEQSIPIPIINEEIAACLSIQATDLIEDYENGKLKGRLKEIAAGLNEESNPVIMLLKHKK